MTVGELRARMSQRELIDWQLFELEQPLPDRLSDLHAAMLASIVVNIARSSDAAPVTPTDFLILRARAPEPDDGLDEIDRQRMAWRGG
jgi:hypothetical protein